jgi:hypothetical protein
LNEELTRKVLCDAGYHGGALVQFIAGLEFTPQSLRESGCGFAGTPN